MLLRPGHLSLDELQAIHAGGQPLLIDPAALPAIQASAAVVQAAAAGDAPVYGVNTGFGKLAGTRISADDLATLQRNLIRSHSVGVGEPLAAPVVRLMLATKAASLARGHSGVRPVVIDTLLAVHNAGLIPYVPSQARSAPPATWRRSATWCWRCWARVNLSSTASASRQPTCWLATASARWCWKPRKAWR
jgi:histidine ammonia-lyase